MKRGENVVGDCKCAQFHQVKVYTRRDADAVYVGYILTSPWLENAKANCMACKRHLYNGYHVAAAKDGVTLAECRALYETKGPSTPAATFRSKSQLVAPATGNLLMLSCVRLNYSLTQSINQSINLFDVMRMRQYDKYEQRPKQKRKIKEKRQRTPR